MKRIFFISIFLLMHSFLLFSQFQITGKVFDNTNAPLSGAIVVLNNGKYFSSTDQFGRYEFKNLSKGEYTLKVQYIGFEVDVKTVALTADYELDFTLTPNDLNELDEIVVRAMRASGKTPVAYTNIKASDIEKNNVGQDIPYILKNTPSVTITSDAGAGVGYTEMRIRGTDLTRINVTLNGIPMNDPESHSVYWVDIPDFASSLDNIQIQRGVGVSTNGAGAFGATINLKSDRLNTSPYAEVSNGYGSFNTIKNSVKFGSGAINEHFVFEGRLSRQTSDGYIDRAWSNLKSFYFSGAYYDSKTLIKATVFSGFEETYQAWNGVPKYLLETDRTYNEYTYENEIDHYVQSHYQLRVVRKFTNNLNIDVSGFYIKGAGYYEQYKSEEDYSDYGLEPVEVNSTTITSTDLIRRKWLDNDYYGINYNVIYNKNRFSTIIGGGWNKYDGSHYGNIIWMQYAGNTKLGYRWYDNLGVKSDLNNFIKMSYDFKDVFNVYADMQYRLIDYSITGFNDNMERINQQNNYRDFFNPKVGAYFHPNDKTNLYFSFGISNKEPRRSDFVDAPSDKKPLPEKLYDYEFGYKMKADKVAFEANLFYMDYKNQLILTGEINDVGDPIYTNTPASFRRGIELIFGTNLISFIDWTANLSLSQNEIENFTEYVDNWSYWDDPENEAYQVENYIGNTNISFSPSIIANNIFSFKIVKFLTVDFASHYVSRQYIDNTSNIERSLDPYFVNDLMANFTFNTNLIKNINLIVKVNNILNEKYETNAWVYSYFYEGERGTLDGYFPQAGTNYMIYLSFKF